MMRKVNLIVMGKTGAGKSTLVNALLGEEVAETGMGMAITQENKKYSKQVIAIDGLPVDINIYDTVGLEIDNDVTEKTIIKIENHIAEVEKECLVNEVTAVWFCINWKCNRFEKYEIELIKKLSVERCIPFIIVLTQCPDDSEGELEKSIKETMPEIPIKRVLAKDYKNRAGLFKSYGIGDLLNITCNEYPRLKIHMAENKIESLKDNEKKRISRLKIDGDSCINKYVKKVSKASWVPLFSIPYIHSMRNRMMLEMNNIFKLNIKSEKTEAIAVGIVATPLLAIPLLSRATAEAYIRTIGESYLKALLELVQRYSNYEMEKSEDILNQIRKSLGGKL